MQIKTQNLFDLEKTIAKHYLSEFDITWQALGGINDYIITLGKTLPKDRYEEAIENIWIAKSAKISPTAFIGSPCIIDENAQIRHCAFIRGSAIVGKNSVVGNSTELKNCILFDSVQVPHFNYIGDSILGYMAHLGAGAVTSNVKSDKSLVTINLDGEKIQTGLKKFGALVGDFTEVGCNAVLCPGTILGKNVTVYPTSCVRGYIPSNTIFKNNAETVFKI